MRKYINWQIPFADINKTQYVIDIYANTPPANGVKVFYGTGLNEGGAIDTDEDEDEDPMCPIRIKTSTIHLVDSDGNLDLIDEIMPRDNTKRFVRMCRLNTEGEKSVVFQGFLSSDSFNQEYLSRVKSIDLTVNSILRAMDDREAMQYVPYPDMPMPDRADCMQGIMTFKQIIDYTILCISRRTGIYRAITDYYIPKYSRYILGKSYNTYDLFKVTGRTNIEFSEKFVEGATLKDVLTRICEYMNWCVRESGSAIYFQDVYDPTMTYEHYRLNKDDEFVYYDEKTIQVVQASDFSMRGTDHEKSITRGAKYVEVTSKLNTMDGMSLPEFPYSQVVKKNIGAVWHADPEKSAVLFGVLSRNSAYYRDIKLDFYKGDLSTRGEDAYLRNITSSNIGEMVDNFPDIPRFPTGADTNDPQPKYAGACFALLDMEYDPAKFIYKKMQEGLYCALLPQCGDEQLQPIFRMNSTRAYRITEGYLHLTTDVILGGIQRYNSINKIFFIEGTNGDKDISLNIKLHIGLKFGNKYWNGADWVPCLVGATGVDYRPFTARLDKRNFRETINPDQAKVDVSGGMLIPVPADQDGQIEIAIFPNFHYDIDTVNIPCAIFMSQLNIEYIRPFDHLLSDRDENVYFDITGFSFNETISKELSIATYNGNLASPSVVLNSAATPMEALEYDDGTTRVTMIPELRKLECMKQYYSAPRRVISMPVAIADTPTTEMVVVGYDGRTYYPLSERIDWGMAKSTLSLYEVGGMGADTDPDNNLPPEKPAAQQVVFSSIPVTNLLSGYCNQASVDSDAFGIGEVEIPSCEAKVVSEMNMKWWEFINSGMAYKMQGFVFNEDGMYLHFPDDYNEDMVLFTHADVINVGGVVNINIGVEGGQDVMINAYGDVSKYGSLAGKDIEIPSGVPFAFVNVNDIQMLKPTDYTVGTVKSVFALNGYDTSGQPAYEISAEFE